MEIMFNKKPVSGVLVLPVLEESVKKMPPNFPKSLQNFLEKRIANKEFSGKEFENLRTFFDGKDLPEKVMFFGFGKTDELTGGKTRELGGRLGKVLKKLNEKEANIILSKVLEENIEPFMEGLLLSQYDFIEFKKNLKTRSKLEKINLILSPGPNSKNEKIKSKIEKAKIISETVNYARNLVNLPSNYMDPERLALESKKIAQENKFRVTVFNKKDLHKMGWGGLLAVNRGSTKEAKAIIIEYKGGSKKDKPIVLVGKGITFDSGGYSLKPRGAIEDMQLDMAGAADVLAIFKVLKKLGIKKNVVGIIPTTENLVNSDAYKPSDIIKMLSGLTVEVTNTDAEGRLILADAVTYANKFNPENIITIATLTGAVAIALGNRYAGIMGNDEKLKSGILEAGKEVDDLGWPLPIHKDYRKKIESQIADIRNSDPDLERQAGSSKGGLFLERFIGENKWCHIDLGGTAFTKDPKEYEIRGGTGHGIRMLIRFLENL